MVSSEGEQKQLGSTRVDLRIRLLRHAESLMSDTEMLHIDIKVQVHVAESLEL